MEFGRPEWYIKLNVRVAEHPTQPNDLVKYRKPTVPKSGMRITIQSYTPDKIRLKTEMDESQPPKYFTLYYPVLNTTTLVEVRSTYDAGEWVFKAFLNGTEVLAIREIDRGPLARQLKEGIV